MKIDSNSFLPPPFYNRQLNPQPIIFHPPPFEKPCSKQNPLKPDPELLLLLLLLTPSPKPSPYPPSLIAWVWISLPPRGIKSWQIPNTKKQHVYIYIFENSLSLAGVWTPPPSLKIKTRLKKALLFPLGNCSNLTLPSNPFPKEPHPLIESFLEIFPFPSQFPPKSNLSAMLGSPTPSLSPFLFPPPAPSPGGLPCRMIPSMNALFSPPILATTPLNAG